jgi:hypothetical protein
MLSSESVPPSDIHDEEMDDISYDIRNEEMDNVSYEFDPPHEGPELANMRTPSPVQDPPVEYLAEERDDQPTSHAHYSEAYPCSAGQPIRKEKTEFEKFRDNDGAAGREPWDPFSSQKEWELATWLMNNVNQRATEQCLNLPMVSNILLIYSAV